MSIRIIAEAGVNHNGNLSLAKELALAAKKAQADVVKFQTFIPELVVTSSAEKAAYQKEETGAGESQLDMVRKLALTFDEFRELKSYCEQIGIAFLSTGFDLQSITFLHDDLGCTLWKIPSGEITNLPLLRQIAGYGQEIILSTGMSTLDEVAAAMDVLESNGCGALALLHCTTAYPAAFEEINLRAMDTLAERFHLPVGFSDHTPGIAIPMAAAARGATVIEKHFTLDRNMEGPDHKASLEPDELAAMVAGIRQVEVSLGTGKKAPTETEKLNMQVARKSIIAARPIAEGEVFTAENLTMKRPGTGISPMQWDAVIGQKASRSFEEDELICL